MPDRTQKLTAEIVAQMRRDYAAGMGYVEIATAWGMSTHATYCAITGRTWSHVEDPPPAKSRRQGQRGEAHYAAKLTRDIVRTMRVRNRLGESIASLAREYGVSKAVARNAIQRRAWR